MEENTIKKLLGLRIKQLRKSKNLTQFAAGELIGIDQRQIAYIECGNCFPSLKTLNKFSKLFNCNLKDLFDYEHLIENSNMKKEFFDNLSCLDDKSLKLCYEIIKTVKNNT